MATVIAPPNTQNLLLPVLPALPAAAVSQEPAVGLLPLLSPILRQRVQILSSSSTEPWLRLLCYDTGKAAKLADLARGDLLEPHPVSGEVEVDWDDDVETRYRRVDVETLQALVVLRALGLAFQLVYCVGDVDGGGDGWRVGEVTVADKPDPFANFAGCAATVDGAEQLFRQDLGQSKTPSLNIDAASTNNTQAVQEEEEEEDDGYWDRYDATPSRTPVPNNTAPNSSAVAQGEGFRSPSVEDAYFSRYDDVQPAMDNHDPDEAAAQAGMAAPPLGLGLSEDVTTRSRASTQGSFVTVDHASRSRGHDAIEEDTNDAIRQAAAAGVLLHPRPESSASSNGSDTVAKLEATADKQGQNEFGVKQHVSRSIRSLWMLSRASGIDREEFERLVQTELNLLEMMED